MFVSSVSAAFVRNLSNAFSWAADQSSHVGHVWIRKLEKIGPSEGPGFEGADIFGGGIQQRL